MALAGTVAVARGWAADPPATDDPRQAVVLAVDGKAFVVSEAGQQRPLKRGERLPQGAVVRTDASGNVDLYFRQIGTVFRLMPGTKLQLDRMEKHMKDGVLVKETIVSLQEGRMLACVRVLVPDSRFEVHTPTTVFAVPAAGVGRYDLRVDGTVIVGKRSRLALRALDAKDQSRTNLVSPGQRYDRGRNQVMEADPATLSDLLTQFDEMQLISDALTPPPQPNELPRAKK
jgi:hypothetical protein